jgi:hypothetical protein
MSAAAEVNYSCVQIGHSILRGRPITGAVQRGNSVTHSVADATRNWCFDSGRPAERNAILSMDFHIAAQRRGGRVAARGGRAAAIDAGDRVSHARIGRVVVAPCGR